MSKYNVGQLLITERSVAISLIELDLDAIAEYPKGEVFEILEVIKDDDGISYRIDFGIDNGQKDYVFPEWTIDSFLEVENIL